MTPIEDIKSARQAIEAHEGSPEEFHLPISNSMQDPMGLSMAIITDAATKARNIEQLLEEADATAAKALQLIDKYQAELSGLDYLPLLGGRQVSPSSWTPNPVSNRKLSISTPAN